MTGSLAEVLESDVPVLVATDFVFTEGPLWDPSGFLFVSDVDDRVHYRVDPATGAKTVIRRDSGGANGATFDLRGRLVMCEQDARRVVRTEADGSVRVIADSFNGKPLNRCNDIVGRSDGSLYFTDPDRLLAPEERAQGSSAIFRLDPQGELHRVATDMNHPNGIAFSPDERKLYVSNSRPDPHLHVYDVLPDGQLRNGEIFSEMPYVAAPKGLNFLAHAEDVRPAAERGGVPDGLKVDEAGRIFCTGPRGTWVWEADGTFLGVICTPELPANIGWGGPDRRTLFLTCRTSVYALWVNTAGTAIPGQSATVAR